MSVGTLTLFTQETIRSIRRLMRAPRFVAVAVLTIGAATAPSLIFSLVSRAVLPMLPFAEPDGLLHVWRTDGNGTGATSFPKLNYLREHSRTMDVAAGTRGVLFLEQSDSSARIQIRAVTPNYFQVFQHRPRLGRGFREDENLRVLEHPVVILSEDLWRSRFGERRDVIGEKVRLSGEQYTVVGVMPALGFYYRGNETAADAWIPAMMAPRGMLTREWQTARVIESPATGIWLGSARLREGHSLSEARAEAAALGRVVAQVWPRSASKTAFELVPMSEDALNPQIVQAVWLLRAAGALVLLLGAINLGSLVATRGMKRSTAIAVHSILGAPRAALIWGTISETLIIGVLGAFTAVALTKGTLTLLGRLEPSILVAPFGVTFDPAGWRGDGSMLAMSLLLAVGAASACGAVSALRMTGRSGADAWRTGAGVLAGGLRGLRMTRPSGVLIVAQVAMALALTLPALLLARSLGNLIAADIGFRPQAVAAGNLELPLSTHPEASVARFVSEITSDLKNAAGVQNASWVSCLPINCKTSFSVDVKREKSTASGIQTVVLVSAGGAFDTLGIPLRAGRDFAADDRAEGPRVAVLSEQAARELGGVLPGARVEVPGGSVEIVGIVGNVPCRDLASKPLPAIYFPLTQSPRAQGFLIIRSSRPLAAAAALVQGTVKALDPLLESFSVSALEERVANDLARFRGAAWLLGAAAALSLFLAGVGIYGLISSVIARALPEIGIRLALGATPQRIGAFVASAAMRLSAMGLILGCALGASGAAYLRPYLFGVAALDAPSLALALIVASLLSVAGALLPAHRASRVDPMLVLKRE